MAGVVLPTAAAPLSGRRRPAAVRLVPTSTSCSRGAETCGFGHVSRAARCLLACERLPKTLPSSPSLPAAAGVRPGTPGSATLCAGLRARDPRRASMARRSTGACPARSRYSVQPRQGVWEGRQGQRGPSRARWRAECYHDYELSDRVAGGGLARRAARRQAALQPFNSVSYLAPLAATACGGRRRPRLASPALPTPTTRASARRPRRLRRARVARRSSGACSAGCAAQPDSLRAPLMRRGAAGGAAAAQLR